MWDAPSSGSLVSLLRWCVTQRLHSYHCRCGCVWILGQTPYIAKKTCSQPLAASMLRRLPNFIESNVTSMAEGGSPRYHFTVSKSAAMSAMSTGCGQAQRFCGFGCKKVTIIYNCTHLTGHTYIYTYIYNIQLCIHIHGVVDMTCPTRYYTCEQEIVSLFFLPVSSEFSLAATFF